MRPSLNAMYKWIDLYGDADIALAFARARPAGGKTKKRIRKQCPVRYKSEWWQRRVYYLRAKNDAIFVVARGEYIVDVFPLQPNA